jgi:hypothetical protein
MRRRFWLAFFVVPVLAFGLVSDVAAGEGENGDGGQSFNAVLTGADLNGTAQVTIDLGTSVLCWEVEYTTTQQVTAAHIHKGAAGVNGPVVFGFYNPPASTVPVNEGCRSGDPALLADIAANPGGYYVNVHTTVHPGGAGRGQLVRDEVED